MSKFKNENYFVVYGWMINDLKLKGNELNIYSIIYGFSQTDNQYFNGSLDYLASATGLSLKSTISRLQSLMQKGLITRFRPPNQRNYVYYCTNLNQFKIEETSTEPNKNEENSIEESSIIVEETSSLNGRNFNHKVEESSIYNIDDNYFDNKEINNIPTTEKKSKSKKKKDDKPTPRAKDEKEPYGTFSNVMLSDKEYQELMNKFPNRYKEKIDSLSEYIESTGKKYKSHYATILSWNRRTEEKNDNQEKKNKSKVANFMDVEI